MFYRISRFLEDEGVIFDVNMRTKPKNISEFFTDFIPCSILSFTLHRKTDILKNVLSLGLRWDVNDSSFFEIHCR